MHLITEYVRASSFPEALKQELAGDAVLHQHAMYLHLPAWLAPLFAPVTPAQIEQLTFSSYFYFRFLLAIDGILDAPPICSDATGQGAQRFLVYCDLFEKSIRGLGDLFPLHDPFWLALDECKQQYAGANLRERTLATSHGPFSLETFEQLAADKSAMCNAIVYALSRLGGIVVPVAALISCLKHVHIALQCMDDVQDFRTDWEQGQYTYAHALVESYLVAELIDVRKLDGSAVHRYLYTSGTAQTLLALGQDHFARAIALAQPLGLVPFSALLAHQLARCAFYRVDIDRQLSLARSLVSLARSAPAAGVLAA